MQRLACDMSVLSLEKRKEHLAASRKLFSSVETISELSNGYEFQLAYNSDTILRAAEFISLEKLCCPFLTFTLEVFGGTFNLRLTGEAGVKEFIREEVSGLLGDVINWTKHSASPR